MGHSHEKSLAVGVRLPINRIVLQRFHYFRQADPRLPVRDVCKQILDELKIIWSRAYIPIKSDFMCLRQIVELFGKWEKTKKIAKSHLPSCLRHKKDFQNHMDQLCDLSHRNSYQILKSTRAQHWNEDWEFLQNQRRVPQIGHMTGVDTILAQKEKRKGVKRKHHYDENNNDEIDREMETHEELDESDICEDALSDEDDFQVAAGRKAARPKQTTLVVPTKTLLSATGEVADRTRLSIRAHLAMQAKLIKVGGQNVSEFSMSCSTAWRQRQRMREELAGQITKEWSPPSFAVIHWDSKLVKDLTGELNERVAILVSGIPLSTPKILGIPTIANATGVSQKNAVVSLLKEWEIEKNVVGVVFDTTANNTGLRNGCATLIEENGKKAILWLTCRHHVYE